jgi:hypothetical protein
MQHCTRSPQFGKGVIALAGAVCLAGSPVAYANASEHLICPAVMATHVDKAAHPGWLVYSNEPLRLTGSDIEYVVDGHLEATLDADSEEQLNDEHLSKLSVFRIAAHRSKGPFALVCHYGVHAQLSRAIPRNIKECNVIHHRRFTEVEFEVSCR